MYLACTTAKLACFLCKDANSFALTCSGADLRSDTAREGCDKSCQRLRSVHCKLQFQEDLLKPKAERRWLCCELAEDGVNAIIILQTQQMLRDAIRLGHQQPFYMDATFGMQRYGLQTLTGHVKDEEDKGMHT